MQWLVAALVIAVIGLAFVAGYVLSRRGNREPTPDETMADARLDAQRILARAEEEARSKAETYRDREDATLEHRRVEMGSQESRLSQREATLEQRAGNLAQREELMIARERTAESAVSEAEAVKEEARGTLERIAGFDSKAAKAELLDKVETEGRRDAMVLIRDLEVKAREESERRARRILGTVIQRLAADVVSETTVSVVPLPSDDMKGRIIGRDGRNIRTFEAVTGVNLIVDDTPEAVSVSTFDPVRREVARRALERLVEGGRIHPSSIEEAYEKSRQDVDQSIRDSGEWALLEVGLTKM